MAAGSHRASELITLLELQPHPEGGHFRELYRSPERVRPLDGRPDRSAVTTIYYLLTAGQVSRWHRVASDEVWHLVEGGPLELVVAPPELHSIERRRLAGADRNTEPVATVPASWWQAARPLGEYALAGCTVAPGFEFADFSFLRDDQSALRALRRHDADLQDLV